MLSAPSSLRPQPRTKAALLQRQSCHLRATCAKHHRRRAVALPSSPQMSRSRCRPAAAVKLLSPLPPLPPRCRHCRYAAATTAKQPLSPPQSCRCSRTAANQAPPLRHRHAAIATAAKLLSPPPRCCQCRYCRRRHVADAAKLPLPNCRHHRAAAKLPHPICRRQRRQTAVTTTMLHLNRCEGGWHRFKNSNNSG